MTPLGMPVEPLVYMMTAMSEGWGCLRSTATVHEQSADDYAGNGSQTTHNICFNDKVILKKGWISGCNQYRFYQLYTLHQTRQNGLNGFRITTLLLKEQGKKIYYKYYRISSLFTHFLCDIVSVRNDSRFGFPIM